MPYFAYPCGAYNDYLINDYFPSYKKEHKIVASFSTDGVSYNVNSSIWKIPRFVSKYHWKSESDFVNFLNAISFI